MRVPEEAVVLAARWQGQDGLSRSQAVLSALRGGARLESLGFVGRWQERWDLRGLEVPGAHIWEEIRLGDVGPHQERWRSELAGAKLSGLDLSYGNLSHAWLEKCTVEDVVLEHVTCVDLRLSSCTFRRVRLEGAILRGAFFLGAPKDRPNRFEDVIFDGADLRGSHHSRSHFVRCSFRDANLKRVDFMASSFVQCRFAGKLDSVWFRGGYPQAGDSKLRGRADPNPMEQVDFSEATLRSVMFVNGIDLRRTILPTDDEHVVVHDVDATLDGAEHVVKSSWSEPDRSTALRALSFVRRPDKSGQPLDVLNKRDIARLLRASREVVTKEAAPSEDSGSGTAHISALTSRLASLLSRSPTAH